jgi:uncharacterized membrane protein
MYLHLLAAIAWIGGSVFMFVLGITLRDKKKQKEVYPHVGPIFGYFELASLILLIGSGLVMITNYHLIELIFSNDDTMLLEYLRKKLILISFLVMATIAHFVVALKTNNRDRTKTENIISRGSSMFIFFINLFIMHYAILIRSILG